MGSNRPTITQIIERITNDAQSRLDEETLRRSDLAVFIRVLAGASHALYSAIEYGRRQLFWDTVEGNYLERWCTIFGITRKSATYAEGTVQFIFSGDLVDIPIGTILQTDGGYQYSTTSSVDSNGQALVKALISGDTYNISEGISLRLVSPIAGVQGATTATEISGGAVAETDEELRARGLEHTHTPPRQGTESDFVMWAKQVEDVGRVWVSPKELGDGTVVIRFLDSSGNLPDDTLVAKVQEHVTSKAFILTRVYVVAPVAQPVDFKIRITPDNLANRASVTSAIGQVFLDEQAPGKSIYLSHINAAISEVADEDDHEIISPAENLTPQSATHMLTLGAIEWAED